MNARGEPGELRITLGDSRGARGIIDGRPATVDGPRRGGSLSACPFATCSRQPVPPPRRLPSVGSLSARPRTVAGGKNQPRFANNWQGGTTVYELPPQTDLRMPATARTPGRQPEISSSPRAKQRPLSTKLGVYTPRAGYGYPRGHPLNTAYHPRVRGLLRLYLRANSYSTVILLLLSLTCTGRPVQCSDRRLCAVLELRQFQGTGIL